MQRFCGCLYRFLFTAGIFIKWQKTRNSLIPCELSSYVLIGLICGYRLMWSMFAEPVKDKAADQLQTHRKVHQRDAFVSLSYRSLQGPVVRSLVSANRWLRDIETYRFPWYLTPVSANHASRNPGQEG